MAGRKYNIADRIARGNQKPTLVLDEGHEYAINTGKSIALKLQAISEENKDSLEEIDDVIKLALGSEAHEYIESQEYTFVVYKEIMNTIVAAFSDKDLEEVEEEEKEGKK